MPVRTTLRHIRKQWCRHPMKKPRKKASKNGEQDESLRHNPDNDRQKLVSRITVRTTPVSDVSLADPKRDCAALRTSGASAAVGS